LERNVQLVAACKMESGKGGGEEEEEEEEVG